MLKNTKISLGIPHKNGSDTDPAELIAAAQASSFSLALSKELGLKDFAPGEIVTTATVTLEYVATDWTITSVHVNVIARLPNVSQGKFIDATLRAKMNCLVSKALRSNVSMNAKLESTGGVSKSAVSLGDHRPESPMRPKSTGN